MPVSSSTPSTCSSSTATIYAAIRLRYARPRSLRSGKWPTNHCKGTSSRRAYQQTVCALGSAGTRRLAVSGARSPRVHHAARRRGLRVSVSAAAQEGYYGVGHDKWHQGFYSKLKRNDGQGSCCNLMDCRPTQSRMVGEARGGANGTRRMAPPCRWTGRGQSNAAHEAAVRIIEIVEVAVRRNQAMPAPSVKLQSACGDAGRNRDPLGHRQIHGRRSRRPSRGMTACSLCKRHPVDLARSRSRIDPRARSPST
jgi:hypothetical protein